MMNQVASIKARMLRTLVLNLYVVKVRDQLSRRNFYLEVLISLRTIQNHAILP